MNRTTVTALAVAAIATGLTPIAHADDLSARDFCLPVMALGVNPNDPGDNYIRNIIDGYPDMTYNQLKSLIETAYNSVHYHQNPTCDGVTIPDNY